MIFFILFLRFCVPGHAPAISLCVVIPDYSLMSSLCTLCSSTQTTLVVSSEIYPERTPIFFIVVCFWCDFLHPEFQPYSHLVYVYRISHETFPG